MFESMCGREGGATWEKRLKVVLDANRCRAGLVDLL